MKNIFTIAFFLFCTFSFAQRVDSLRKIVNGNGEDTSKIKAMIYLSEAIRRSNLEEAYALNKKAIAWTDSLHADPRFKAFAQMGQGTCLSWLGEFDSSIYYFNLALPYFKSHKKTGTVSGIYNGLANSYGQEGKYSEALPYYFEGLKIATESDNKDNQATLLGNIANTYANMDNGATAIKYYRQSIALHEELKDYTATIANYNNMSGLYLDMGLMVQLDSCMNKTEELIKKYGDKNDSAFYFSTLGKVRLEKKDYAGALKYLNMAIALDTIIGENSSAATNTMEIALVYISMRDTATANIYMKKGYDAIIAMNELPILEDAYEAIADRYAEIGMPMESYKLLKKLLILQDTLHSNELNELIAKKEAGFQNEKKQHEIDNYKKNEEINSLQYSRTKFLVAFLVVAVLVVLLGIVLLFRRNKAKQVINDELEKKNMEITTHQKSISDSINYAKRIQDSILPPLALINRVLPDGFILYEPKDVVSGDFYWLDNRDGLSIFAAVDCTGHGVPGAMMSVVGFNLLNQAVNEMGLTKPSEILHHLDFGVNKLLRQSDSGNTVKDGMDLGLCTYDPETKKLQFAGVFNPAYIISKGELKQINADKFPIGTNVEGVTDNYTNNEIQLYPGDMVYLFSDGYADQFGGPMGKKFKYNSFRKLLLNIQDQSAIEQREALRNAFLEWKGNLEQVDDILVIGMRVH